MVRGLGSLLGISFCCALLLGLTHQLTTARIERNQTAHFWRQVNQLTGIDAHAFRVEWQGDVWHLCNGLALVRGETRGYGGPIHLLAALQLETGQDGTDQIVVRGVSVTRHQETPGIADFISQPEHPWLQRLIELGSDRIGNVEAVTGATITSKAILRGLDDITHYPALVRSRCPQ